MARAAETIAGRYELHEVLGRGGMSVVYRATDQVLDRTVAVKVLPAAYAENPVLVERFSREARAVARLSHPNIVAVYDSGFDRTVHYIVMECVPGQSLAQVLKERGVLGVAEAVEIATQVSSALAAAHAAGIVHRDIKPANVMIQPSGTVKVLDFGIARARDDADLTRTTTVLGSAPYMAPEVAMGRPADARSDIYSLGCVIYEMLSGAPPFMADLPLAVMHLHANAEPQPLRERGLEVPERLDALVLQMLSKEPADRPQRADELAGALHDAIREDAPNTAATLIAPIRQPAAGTEDRDTPATAQTRRIPPAPPPTPPPASRVDETAAMPPARAGSSRRAWLIAAAALVALATGIAVALASSSGSNGGHATTATHSHHRTSPSTPSTSTSSSPSTTSSSSSSTPSHSSSTTTTSVSSTTSSPASSRSTTSSTQPASTSSPAATSSTTTP